MIGLSTVTFDLQGFIILQPIPGSDRIYDFDRRVNRVGTLDLDTYTTDLGFTEADRKFDFEVMGLNLATVNQLRALFKNYSQLILTTDEGAFFVTPKRFRYTSGRVILNLLSRGAA